MEQPLAVITGVKEGIGYELARQFAVHNYDLLIVSDSDDIFLLQEELLYQGHVVEALKMNLGTFAGVENLYQRIIRQEKHIDTLVINATTGVGGEFSETNLKEEIQLINLNIVSAIHLVKRMLPEMKALGAGKILFTSVMPSPYEAVYDASMAFLKSFADTIRAEVKPWGLGVTILTPEGGTENKFENELPEVARLSYEALRNGRERVFTNNLFDRLQGAVRQLIHHQH